jgi:S-adenosylmethionine:tRNA ribosyltransferase-isomerase
MTTATLPPAPRTVPGLDPIAPRSDVATSFAPSTLDFELPSTLEAHEPPEARGLGRSDVRLLVSRGLDAPVHARFTELPAFLAPGDLLVVNTSATVPAALDGRLGARDGRAVRVHVSTELPGGLWLVELREPTGDTTRPFIDEPAVHDVELRGGAVLRLLARAPASQRLWLATFDGLGRVDGGTVDDVVTYLYRFGRPIRYAHVPRSWPLHAYQTVFATEPGSAEMPSASRPFTTDVITELVARGIAVTPLVLHTGVSSLEGEERPYAERYRVPSATAARVNATRAAGGRVVAAGTTVVRALETVVADDGTVHPGEGWTDVVVTPERGVRAVDGLLTGWHEPRASHLLMLEAVAGREALERAYESALRSAYLWHEFGDSHLILPDRPTLATPRR